MSNYAMPDLTGASCAGLGIDMFYDEVIVEKVVEVEIGDNTYNMTRSTAPIQHAYLRKVCLACPVVQECREWGILHEEYGFWGGLTATERASERVLRGIQVDEPQYERPPVNDESEREFGNLPQLYSHEINSWLLNKDMQFMRDIKATNGIMEGEFQWM